MRIYTINIDATPLFSNVQDYLKARKFQQTELLTNGLFTASAFKSIYYGKVYDTVRPGDPLLLDILLEDSYRIVVHEDQHQFVPEYLKEQWCPKLHPSSRALLRQMSPTLNNEKYGDIIISAAMENGEPFHGWHLQEEYDRFMKEERQAIAALQGDSYNAYTHALWMQYHDFVYYEHGNIDDTSAYLDRVKLSLVDWLAMWNFDEPDAVFMIFSDHGDYVHRLTPPKDYLRWCFIKDNTSQPLKPRQMIAAIDLFRTILDKIGHSFDYSTYDCQPLDAPIDRNRIYHVADTRYWDDNRKEEALSLEKQETHQPISISDVDVCMTATAVRFIEWADDDLPSRLLQATYYRYTKQYFFLLFSPDWNDPIHRYSFFEPDTQEYQVIKSMKEYEDLRTHMIELCESLSARFPWIENRECHRQIDANDFPEWMEP